jgi:hypothetical protein
MCIGTAQGGAEIVPLAILEAVQISPSSSE